MSGPQWLLDDAPGYSRHDIDKVNDGETTRDGVTSRDRRRVGCLKKAGEQEAPSEKRPSTRNDRDDCPCCG